MRSSRNRFAAVRIESDVGGYMEGVCREYLDMIYVCMYRDTSPR